MRRSGIVAAVIAVVGTLLFGAREVSQNEQPRVGATPFLGAHQGEVFYLCSWSARQGTGTAAVEVYKGRCKAPGDKSTYTVPVLYRNGVATKPSKMHVYIRNITNVKPLPFPAGFQYTWGNPKAITAQPDWSRAYFWQCGDTKASTHYPTPPNCPNATNGQGETALTLIFRFGQCWDGTRLTWPEQGTCGTKKTFVRIEPHWQYTIADGANAKMSLASGSIFGVYSGFTNGFDPAVLQSYIDKCVDRGLSCHVRSDGLLPV